MTNILPTVSLLIATGSLILARVAAIPSPEDAATLFPAIAFTVAR